MKFKYSNRNKTNNKIVVFYYCKGRGFDAGREVFYGRSEFFTEKEAIEDQEKWEKFAS